MKLFASIAAVCFALLIFVLFDAGCGSHANALGVVAGKHRIPAWVETQWDGDNSTTTIYHPEQWIVEVDYDNDVREIPVHDWEYDRLLPDQRVIVNYQTGKWTRWHYLQHIDPDLSVEH